MNSESIQEMDVIVCGGGPGGFAAALAAARNGARTLLIEQYAFLGGNMAMYLPVWTFHTQRGKQVIKGIPQELVDRLAAMGGTTGHHMDPFHSSVTVVDVEKLKYTLQEMCLEAGVTLLLHSLVFDTIVEDGAIKGVVVANKAGRQVIRGKVFIDATGDGDLAARAGVPFEKGRPGDGAMQPPTLMFRVGDVDIEKFMNAVTARGKGESGHVNYDYDAYLKGYQFVFFGFDDLIQRAAANGELPVPWTFIFVTTHRPGEVAVNMGKVPGTDATDPLSLTHAEIEGRRNMFKILPVIQKYIPGFEQCHLINSAHQIGIRDSRRIKGEYTLTLDDLIHNTPFPDSIALNGYQVDVHSPAGIGNLDIPADVSYGYHVPYRCLVPLKVDNLLAAGRCISVDWTAFGSMRISVICMAIGQAAGTAAAVCVKRKTTPRQVNVQEVQEALVKGNAIIDLPSMYDQETNGFFRVHPLVKQLTADKRIAIELRLHNFTNEPASATIELKPQRNIAFDKTTLASGTIAPFTEQAIWLTGQVADLAGDIGYLAQLNYASGIRVSRPLCHILPASGLKDGWEGGEWQSRKARPEDFRGDASTAPLHGARFNVSRDDRGIQLLIDVRDDFLGPSDVARHKGLWNVDLVELFLDGREAPQVGTRRCGKGVCQIILYPGDPGKTPAFYHVCGRAPTDRPITLELSSQRTSQGYRLRARIPFSSFCVEQALPSKIGVGLSVNTVNKHGWRIGQYVCAGGPNNWCDASGFREVLFVGYASGLPL